MFKISCSIIEFEISCFVDEKLYEGGSSIEVDEQEYFVVCEVCFKP